jgi:ATP-binding protein involved in chromosome partitioning
MLIRETSDGGKPVVASAPDSPQARAYLDIAEKLRVALFETAKKRILPRIFMS